MKRNFIFAAFSIIVVLELCSFVILVGGSMTNIEYIYDPVNKIAFSYLIDRGYDDWILDDYVIRDWVESIPEKRVSITSLANSYKIIAL